MLQADKIDKNQIKLHNRAASFKKIIPLLFLPPPPLQIKSPWYSFKAS